MGINTTQLFNNLVKVAEQKNINQEQIIDILKFSLEKAYLKENPETKPLTEINAKKKEIKLYEVKTVVQKKEEDIDDDIEISLEEASKIDKKAFAGQIINVEVNISNLEKRVVLHVQQIFQQKLNEILNLKVYDEWKDKIGTVVRAEVERADNRYIEVNLGKTMGVLLRNEQIPGENLQPGQSYLFLIKDIKEQTRGWPIILSRADDKFLEYILKSNIPELESGLIEIKMIARIPGFKSKIVIAANDPNIDPIGTCVGVGGKRIKDISAMLNNERIDVINYSEDPKQLLINACAPEKIIGLEITDDENSKIVTIVCDDADLPKLVGKNGINVKLLSRLTRWSIDIVSLTIAVEDKIKYEDVTSMLPIKFLNQNRTSLSGGGMKRSPTSFDANQSTNRKSFFTKKEFGNQDFNQVDSSQTNEWDNKISRQAEQITDEDIENLLNFNSSNTKKKKKTGDENLDDFKPSPNKQNKPAKKRVDVLDEYADDLLVDDIDDDMDESIIDFNDYDDLD